MVVIPGKSWVNELRSVGYGMGIERVSGAAWAWMSMSA